LAWLKDVMATISAPTSIVIEKKYTHAMSNTSAPSNAPFFWKFANLA